MPTIPTYNNTPALRFPDFLNDGEWEVKRLEEISDYENGIAHENDIDSDGDFIIVNSKFISSDGQIKKRTNVPRCLAQKDDVLMVLSDLPNGRALAKCFYVAENNLYTVNQRICKFHSKNVNSKLLYYLVNRNEYFLSFDDGVKQTNLKKGDVLNCPLIIPKSIEEQDFIATCLTSLDELLSATNGKLEQLKVYKKGLMQKLFPAKGNKLPELRFKKFEKDGEWEEKRLGDYLYEHKTKSDGKCQVYSVSVTKGVINQMEYLGRSFASSDTSNYKLVKPFDIVYTKSPTGEFPYGIIKQSLIGHNVIVSPLYGVFSPSNQYIGYIIHSYFESSTRTNNYLAPIVQKGAKNTIQISNDVFLSQNVCLPSNENEQRKIASCLSTMDDQINAYTEKVALLGQYKKGLMQRMFSQNQMN